MGTLACVVGGTVRKVSTNSCFARWDYGRVYPSQFLDCVAWFLSYIAVALGVKEPWGSKMLQKNVLFIVCFIYELLTREGEVADRLPDYLTDWIDGWKAGSFLAVSWCGSLAGWLAVRHTSWLADWVAEWLAGWLASGLDDWLAGCLASVLTY